MTRNCCYPHIPTRSCWWTRNQIIFLNWNNKFKQFNSKKPIPLEANKIQNSNKIWNRHVKEEAVWKTNQKETGESKMKKNIRKEQNHKLIILEIKPTKSINLWTYPSLFVTQQTQLILFGLWGFLLANLDHPKNIISFKLWTKLLLRLNYIDSILKFRDPNPHVKFIVFYSVITRE